MYNINFKNKRGWKLRFFLMVRIIEICLMTTLFAFLFSIIFIKLVNFPERQIAGFYISLIWYTVCLVGTTIIIYHLMKNMALIVEDISDAAKKVAEGDFSVRIKPTREYNDMVANLYNDFNSMVEALGTIETLQNGFVADVSHEFKTPIAAIEGYAQLLQDDTISEEEKKSYLDSIIYNSKRLSTLTGNILMISKLENSSIKPKCDKFSLDEQLRRIVLNFEEQWSEKNLELDIDLDNVKYYGDEDLLYNVWLNLISNAIKFSKNDGKLSIKLIDNKYNVVVKIKDSGVGMSEETINRMFDKFYQGDTSRAQEGNGLGLALVKKILDICKADIKVNSEIDKGTELIITLPIM